MPFDTVFTFSNISGSQLTVRRVPPAKLMRIYEAGEQYLCSIECSTEKLSWSDTEVQNVVFTCSDAYKMRDLFGDLFHIIFGGEIEKDSGFQF